MVAFAGFGPAWAEDPKVAVLPTQIDPSAREIPQIIDDYVLTAVQDLGGLEVIGQDDIGAILGFEKQKELFGCDDTSCFAQIGGALGVAKLVVVRVAKVASDWAVTAKLMQIQGEPRVDARNAEFVSGSAKELLRSIGPIVAALFSGNGHRRKTLPEHAAEPPAQQSAQAAAPTPAEAISPRVEQTSPAAEPEPQPDPNRSRVVIFGQTEYGMGISSASSQAMGVQLGGGFEIAMRRLRLTPHLLGGVAVIVAQNNTFTKLNLRPGVRLGFAVARWFLPFAEAHVRVGVPTGSGTDTTSIGVDLIIGADFCFGNHFRLGLGAGVKPTGNSQRLLTQARLSIAF